MLPPSRPISASRASITGACARDCNAPATSPSTPPGSAGDFPFGLQECFEGRPEQLVELLDRARVVLRPGGPPACLGYQVAQFLAGRTCAVKDHSQNAYVNVRMQLQTYAGGSLRVWL